MIIDSSVLIAILNKEHGYSIFVDAIARATVRKISAPNWLETAMVYTSKKGPDGLARLDRFRAEAAIDIVNFTADHVEVARQAFLIYGKGRGHPAALNFGDCMAYATAKLEMMPLLFKGDDFRQTDIEAAV